MNQAPTVANIGSNHPLHEIFKVDLPEAINDLFNGQGNMEKIRGCLLDALQKMKRKRWNWGWFSSALRKKKFSAEQEAINALKKKISGEDIKSVLYKYRSELRSIQNNNKGNTDVFLNITEKAANNSLESEIDNWVENELKECPDNIDNIKYIASEIKSCHINKETFFVIDNDKKITSPPLKAINLLKHLEELIIDPAQNVSLTLEGLPKLKRLKITRGNLEYININGIPNLNQLEIKKNKQLKNLCLVNLPCLNSFNAFDTTLTNVNIDNVPKMRTVNLMRNDLTVIPEALLHDNLKRLSVEENPMKSSHLKNLPSLEVLRFIKCDIDSIELKNTPKLSRVELRDNQLESVPESLLTELPDRCYVDVRRNNITETEREKMENRMMLPEGNKDRIRQTIHFHNIEIKVPTTKQILQKMKENLLKKIEQLYDFVGRKISRKTLYENCFFGQKDFSSKNEELAHMRAISNWKTMLEKLGKYLPVYNNPDTITSAKFNGISKRDPQTIVCGRVVGLLDKVLEDNELFDHVVSLLEGGLHLDTCDTICVDRVINVLTNLEIFADNYKYGKSTTNPPWETLIKQGAGANRIQRLLEFCSKIEHHESLETWLTLQVILTDELQLPVRNQFVCFTTLAGDYKSMAKEAKKNILAYEKEHPDYLVKYLSEWDPFKHAMETEWEEFVRRPAQTPASVYSPIKKKLIDVWSAQNKLEEEMSNMKEGEYNEGYFILKKEYEVCKKEFFDIKTREICAKYCPNNALYMT